MPRTADRMMAREWVFPLDLRDNEPFMDEVRALAASSPVIVADNVAQYLQGRTPTELSDFPSLAPPWPTFWIEYGGSGLQRRGVLVVDSTDADPSSTWAAQEQDLKATEEVWPSAKWLITLALFVDQREGVWGPVGSTTIALDQDGHPIADRWSLAPVAELATRIKEPPPDDPPPLPHSDLDISTDMLTLKGMTRSLDRMSEPEREAAFSWAQRRADEYRGRLAAATERVGRLNEQIADCEAKLDAGERVVALGIDEDHHRWLIRAVAPALQTIGFLHCKNVVTDEQVPDAKVQRKRRNRGKEPLVRYHTLRLDVPRRQSQHGGGRSEGLTAHHIVAGHFAHYGACCSNHEPNGRLFGRLEGIYWVPSHVRGDRQAGTVHTDFDIEPLEV